MTTCIELHVLVPRSIHRKFRNWTCRSLGNAQNPQTVINTVFDRIKQLPCHIFGQVKHFKISLRFACTNINFWRNLETPPKLYKLHVSNKSYSQPQSPLAVIISSLIATNLYHWNSRSTCWCDISDMGFGNKFREVSGFPPADRGFCAQPWSHPSRMLLSW